MHTWNGQAWNGQIERISPDGLLRQVWGFRDYNASALDSIGIRVRLGVASFYEQTRPSPRHKWRPTRHWGSHPGAPSQALSPPEIPTPDNVMAEALQRFNEAFAPITDPKAHLVEYLQEEKIRSEIEQWLAPRNTRSSDGDG